MTIPCNTDIQSLLYMLLSTPYHPLFPPIKWSKEIFNRFFPGKDYSDEYAILSDHFLLRYIVFLKQLCRIKVLQCHRVILQ